MIDKKSAEITIYAFEPGPKNLRELEQRFCEHGNVRIIPYALSRDEDTLIYFENYDLMNSGWNSLYDMKSIGFDSSTRKIDVSVVTLDGFCKGENIEHIDFMKIDVEGHALAVLNGAESILRNCRVDYVQFEFGHAARAARVYLFDLVNFMHQHNYSIFVIKPKYLEPLKYTPWLGNRFNMINFLADSPSCLDNLKPIIKHVS